MTPYVAVLAALALATLALLAFLGAWLAGRRGAAAARVPVHPAMAAREAAYRAEVERVLDALEEARRRGDAAGLRLCLEDAMYAWLAYSVCAADPEVREARRRVLLMLAGWHASLAAASGATAR